MPWGSLVFDFDSTVVDCETLELVSARALAGRADRDLVLAEVQRLTALGMEGQLPFGESLARRMALFAPHRDDVAAIAAEMPRRISASFLAHADFVRTHRECIAIVSGGFEELIWSVADVLGIDRARVYANAFVYDADGIATGVDQTRPTAHAGGKVRALREAALPHPIIMVGDGWTDYEARAEGVADSFIAYTEHAQREKVIAQADAIAASFDDLLALLEAAPKSQ